jgi:hypothetical protein
MLGRVVVWEARMSRWWLAAAAMLIAGPAFADPPDPAEQHLRGLALTCIQANAAAVERVEATMTDAVDFLVKDLCHDQIQTDQRYLSNTELIQQMRSGHSHYTDLFDFMADRATPAERAQAQQQIERVRAEWQTAEVDPITGDLIGPTVETARIDNASGAGMEAEMADLDTRSQMIDPTDTYRAAAAQAVLAARTARLAGPH